MNTSLTCETDNSSICVNCYVKWSHLQQTHTHTRTVALARWKLITSTLNADVDKILMGKWIESTGKMKALEWNALVDFIHHFPYAVRRCFYYCGYISQAERCQPAVASHDWYVFNILMRCACPELIAFFICTQFIWAHIILPFHSIKTGFVDMKPEWMKFECRNFQCRNETANFVCSHSESQCNCTILICKWIAYRITCAN